MTDGSDSARPTSLDPPQPSQLVYAGIFPQKFLTIRNPQSRKGIPRLCG